MQNRALCLCMCIALLIGSGFAADVPFVFDSSSSRVAGYSADQLVSMLVSSPYLAGVPAVTTPSDGDILEFPVTDGGITPENTTTKNAGDLKKALDARVKPDNSRVRDEAVVLALKYPGENTIEQIASIYNYLKNGDGSKKGWGYVSDPIGIDYFMFANQTLKNGDRANCVGGGDCDDFAILMSALVESIGGTTRIIFAQNKTTGGHAYAEVYPGNLSDQYDQVDEIINWLKQEFNTDDIYTHIDTNTKGVWLNLDWGVDEKGIANPGGPIYQGDRHIIVFVRPFGNASLKLPETEKEKAEMSPANAWVNEGRALEALGRKAEADAAFAKARELGYIDKIWLI
ncbi:MAG: transglutaminase family protein [Methanothrix sp.]